MRYWWVGVIDCLAIDRPDAVVMSAAVVVIIDRPDAAAIVVKI